MLSPRTFKVKSGKSEAIGSCRSCCQQVRRSSRSDVSPTPLPPFSISNGLMIGKAPETLEKLNEVERALISRGRINKHIFSFEAGSHKSIKGWHTMFYNDVYAVLGVSNWAQKIETENICNRNDKYKEEEEDNVAIQMKRTFPEICVILTGPFTPMQKAKVMAKTKINYSNVKNALLWLKEHNRLYKDIDTETFVSVTPHVVDESEAVMSVYNNIEEVYEVFAIFPDKNLPCSTNGGCENSGELKDLTIECLLLSGGSKDATLICRPTKNILRDYQGNNSLLAYPVQFPYGIGCKDSKGDYRAGYPYLKHLCSLSHPNFHQANWVCVLYNMMERLRMIRASYLKTKEEEREMFCKITSDEMASAVSRFAK
ncbi:hypothetical protein IV203_038319 [Nitzschia inconspicua]|uniref:DUF6570 domain-containing protein n=1 Tax=Nitzschia inconspicua TaxID=303405 RepID=A0A9K3LR71_9STRA|nr:hypothetical protein IV203_038319 [Nitzschia inconspicua]